MANRIDKKFAELRGAGKSGFIAYITAGDPTLEATEQLVPALVLIAWAEDRKTFLWTDACATGVGWCITQIRDGKHYLVHAGGRRTAPFEARLSTPELEALALRHAFQEAPDMLVQTSAGVVWFTDAQAVALARAQKSQIKSRAVRQFFAELLAREFGSVEIVRIPGKRNLADALSRQWEAENAEAQQMIAAAPVALVTAVGGGVGDETTEAASGEAATVPTTPVLVQAHGDDDVEPEPEPSEAAKAAQVVTPPAAAVGQDHVSDVPTPQQLQAIEEALQAEGLMDTLTRERREWAFAQANDDSPFMSNVRKVQKGVYVANRHARKQVYQNDAYGRTFLLDRQQRRRLVVPDVKLYEVMFALHGSLVHRHPHSMVKQFDQQFHNPRALEVAKQVVADCMRCQQVDAKPKDGVMGFDDSAKERFQAIALDVFEIGGDATQHRYGLMVVDIVTGVMEIVPMREHTAEAVVEAFMHGYATRWPTPQSWQSDNAQELIGTAMSEVERTLHIKRVQIANQNPAANGVVERAIGLFKTALRKLTPLGDDWVKYVDQARWGLMCAVSTARGGFAPIELATGVKPVMVARAQADPAEATPAAVREQGKQAEMQWRVQETRKLLQPKVVRANASRAARNAAAAKSAKKKATVEPVQWKEGMLAWVEDQPYANAAKFDRKVKRSRIVVLQAVDAKRLRAKVADWETRLPHKGFVPFRRLSLVRGEALVAIGKAGSGEQQVQEAVVSTPQPAPTIQVPTDFGIIVDVTSTTDGLVVVLAEAAPDGSADMSAPMMQVDGKDLPAHAVREAWRLKHLLHAPKVVKKRAARKN